MVFLDRAVREDWRDDMSRELNEESEVRSSTNNTAGWKGAKLRVGQNEYLF